MEQSSIYTPRAARIVETTQVTPREKMFMVETGDGRPLGHVPGQFVGVSVFGVGEAPISVSSSPTAPGGRFELCIRNAGSVTAAIHRLAPGNTIGIRGPFGRGFPLGDLRGMDLVFIAGGLGLAPLRSMINYAVDRRDEFGRLTLVYGARTPSDMLFTEEQARWSGIRDFTVDTTVDIADGAWSGNVGVITKLVDRLELEPARTAALVIGPPVMFRFVVKAALSKGVYESRIYLSLERRMKCGVGKCGHCQIDDIYLCRKGPVMPYTRLRKLPEAV